MYAREKFGAVGPALQPTNWPQDLWVEARGFSPAKKRCGAGRYRSRWFTRAKVFLPCGAEQFAAGKAAPDPAMGRPAFSSHYPLDTSHLPLHRSIHSRVETHLSSCHINNLIFADRYTFISPPKLARAPQKFAAAKDSGGPCVYNAGAAGRRAFRRGRKRLSAAFQIRCC
jgi:hypothetical protein